MAVRATMKKTDDAYEEKAGRVGNALAILGTPQAAELHQRLVGVQQDAEAARLALDEGKAQALVLRARARAVAKSFKNVLASMPDVGALVLKLEEPAPALSAFEVWDPEVRCEELVAWLKGKPEVAWLGARLEEAQNDARAAAEAASQAEAQVKKLAQEHGAARFRLQMMAKECELHVRLHTKRDSEARRAFVVARPNAAAKKSVVLSEVPSVSPSVELDAVEPAASSVPQADAEVRSGAARPAVGEVAGAAALANGSEGAGPTVSASVVLVGVSHDGTRMAHGETARLAAEGAGALKSAGLAEVSALAPPVK